MDRREDSLAVGEGSACSGLQEGEGKLEMMKVISFMYLRSLELSTGRGEDGEGFLVPIPAIYFIPHPCKIPHLFLWGIGIEIPLKEFVGIGFPPIICPHLLFF